MFYQVSKGSIVVLAFLDGLGFLGNALGRREFSGLGPAALPSFFGVFCTGMACSQLVTAPRVHFLGDEMNPKRVYGSYTLIGTIVVMGI